jgi:DNA-binding NarL/FixJ family response regulator
MKRITVLLVDDHTVVRQGLRALLEMEDDIEVVGEGANGVEAVEMARDLRPAIVVLDLAMPQLNGLEAARRILQLDDPRPRVLVLSAHGDDAYIEQVAALGVHGYLLKQASANVLATAIREILRGKVFYSPAIAKRLEDQEPAPPTRRDGGRRNLVHLTSREREVLQLVAEGNPNKLVAAELGISIKTVEKHRQGAMHKLDIHDTASLTRYAISAGIVESSVQSTIDL